MIDTGVILLLALLVAGVLVLAAIRLRRVAPPVRGPGARCGACGYDTTGLVSGLTCPECGSDLRLVGITRQPPSNVVGRFIGSSFAFVAAWVLCGVVLGMVVEEVMPRRRHFTQDSVLGAPASRAYGAIAVVAEGTGWGESAIPVRVRIELRQLLPVSGPPVPATVPAPLFVDVPTGAYRYADASGQTVSKPNGFGADAVLAWLSAAGIKTGDPRVHDEARLAWLYALRAGRRPRPAASLNGATSSSTTGTGGPFDSVRVSETANIESNRWGVVTLLCLWGVVLMAGLVYLWHHTAGQRSVRPPTPTASLL